VSQHRNKIHIFWDQAVEEEKNDCYGDTPPYGHLANAVNLLLLPHFMSWRNTMDTFSCKKTLLNSSA